MVGFAAVDHNRVFLAGATVGQVPRTHQPREGLSWEDETERNVGTGNSFHARVARVLWLCPLEDRPRGSLRGGEALGISGRLGKTMKEVER
jgi:hypothetical protein